jgi:hypothetical protein
MKSERFHHQPGALVQALGVFIEANDICAVLAELHIAGRRNTHRLLCVNGHFLGMDIDGSAVSSENLVFPASNLRTPFPTVLVEHMPGLFRIDENCPCVPAIFNRKLIELAKHTGRTHSREAVDGHNANVFPSDARFDTPIEVFASEYLVEVGRYLGKGERMIYTANTTAQVLQKPIMNMLLAIIIDYRRAPQPPRLKELSENVLERVQF